MFLDYSISIWGIIIRIIFTNSNDWWVFLIVTSNRITAMFEISLLLDFNYWQTATIACRASCRLAKGIMKKEYLSSNEGKMGTTDYIVTYLIFPTTKFKIKHSFSLLINWSIQWKHVYRTNTKQKRTLF